MSSDANQGRTSQRLNSGNNVALIADIVGSRSLVDRAGAQITIESAIERIEKDVHVDSRKPLRATIGDEFQGSFAAVEPALHTTLLLQLALPDGIELRFGIGIGALVEISSSVAMVTEGPGWWAARAAIGVAARHQRRDLPRSRTRVASAASADASATSQTSALNAYLALRDEIVGSMSARQRRVTYARMSGVSQADIALAEGITQPAVSKMLRSSGSAAIIMGARELSGVADRGSSLA